MTVSCPTVRATAVGVRCPVCALPLAGENGEWRCAAHHVFPEVNGVPVLINEERSVFALADYTQGKVHAVPTPSARSRLSRYLPRLSHNDVSPANYRAFGHLVRERFATATILVVGGRTVGAGMDDLHADPRLTFVETDLQFGPQVQIICDAHDLPFPDATFEGVIIQAVLEHVADPPRCVAEIHRVLKPGGVVYAETPFMQHVHGAAYDFTRYTHLGHRRLFRHFDEVESGPIGGPGMALAWSWRAFLKSWAGSPLTQRGMELVARLTGFWLKYCDRLLMRRPAAFDYGWAYYFLGTRAEEPISDRALIRQYRGSQ